MHIFDFCLAQFKVNLYIFREAIRVEVPLLLKGVILEHHVQQAVDIQVLLRPKEVDTREVHHPKVGIREDRAPQQVVILEVKEDMDNHKLIQALHNGLVQLTLTDPDR